MENVRFGDRTVGVSRYWNAKTAGNKVDRMVSIQLDVWKNSSADVQDVVIIQNGYIKGQYKIIQIQIKYDSSPPTAYLTLEKLIHPFKDMRKNGQD